MLESSTHSAKSQGEEPQNPNRASARNSTGRPKMLSATIEVLLVIPCVEGVGLKVLITLPEKAFFPCTQLLQKAGFFCRGGTYFGKRRLICGWKLGFWVGGCRI